MAQYLWTGMWTLGTPEQKQPFGSIAAKSPFESEGTVLVSLRADQVATQMAADSAELRLTEKQALELEKKLSLVLARIAHLRSLRRLGHLSPEAIHEDTEEQRISTEPEQE